MMRVAARATMPRQGPWGYTIFSDMATSRET